MHSSLIFYKLFRNDCEFTALWLNVGYIYRGDRQPWRIASRYPALALRLSHVPRMLRLRATSSPTIIVHTTLTSSTTRPYSILISKLYISISTVKPNFIWYVFYSMVSSSTPSTLPVTSHTDAIAASEDLPFAWGYTSWVSPSLRPWDFV